MNIIIFITLSTLFLAIIEFIKRKFKIESGITRRISHIGSAIIAFISPWFLDKYTIIVICICFAVVMFFSRRHKIYASIHAVKRKTYGEVFLPLGEALAAAIYLPQSLPAFQFGILVMGISDALAGFVGEKYGRHKLKIFKSQKSIEGTLTFFIVTLLITFVFMPTFGAHLLLIPLILTGIEFIHSYGTDNLILPLAAGLLFSLAA